MRHVWLPVFEIMRDDLRIKKKTYVVFTSRDNIFNTNKKTLKLYYVIKHVVNLSDWKLTLSDDDMENMFTKYAAASNLHVNCINIVHDKTCYKRSSSVQIGYPQRIKRLLLIE